MLTRARQTAPVSGDMAEQMFVRLLADNGVTRAALDKFVAAADAPAPAAGEIIIHEAIVSNDTARMVEAFFGVVLTCPRAVRDRLSEINGDVTVRINSPGGSYFAGVEIHAMLLARRSAGDTVTAVVEGIAASAATLPMVAAGTVRATSLSMIMIHGVLAAAYGSSEEIRKTADVMDKMNSAVAAEYNKRLGLKHADVRALLADDTFYTAVEARDAGLVDEVVHAVDDADDADARDSLTSAAASMRAVTGMAAQQFAFASMD